MIKTTQTRGYDSEPPSSSVALLLHCSKYRVIYARLKKRLFILFSFVMLQTSRKKLFELEDEKTDLN